MPPSHVRLNNFLSTTFDVGRGVKQGSVLSPTLFLTVIDSLFGCLRESNLGTSTRGVYTDAAIHADDLHTAASSCNEVLSQGEVIKTFTQETCLSLSVSKLEVVKISQSPQTPENLTVAVTAKCLGV